MKLLPGVKVAVIGNSHMEALGPRLSRLLPGALGVTLTNVEARRGWSTRRYLQSGDIPGLARGADVVIVELGGNDASAHIGANDHAQDVFSFLRQVGDKKVVWIGPGVTTRVDLEARRAPIRDGQRAALRAAGQTWVDARPMTSTRLLAPDGVHFRGDGYDAWAEQLVRRLAKGDVSWVAPTLFAVGGVFAIGAYLWARSRR